MWSQFSRKMFTQNIEKLTQNMLSPVPLCFSARAVFGGNSNNLFMRTGKKGGIVGSSLRNSHLFRSERTNRVNHDQLEKKCSRIGTIISRCMSNFLNSLYYRRKENYTTFTFLLWFCTVACVIKGLPLYRTIINKQNYADAKSWKRFSCIRGQDTEYRLLFLLWALTLFQFSVHEK